MKLIKSSEEYLQQDYTYEGIIKHIEKCARICYKSDDKQSESFRYSEKFVQRLIDCRHTAMLEHGTVYLMIRRFLNPGDTSELSKYKHNSYSYENEVLFGDNTKGFYVTTNFRVLEENDWLDDLQYICEPTEFHNKRYTFKLVTSISIGRELLRHRKFSFANESTRYCNYSKNRFNNELTFIIPSWLPNLDTFPQDERPQEDTPEYNYYTMMCALGYAEENYFALLNNGCSPQQAREVLPLCTKSELIMTGFKSDWEHFFDLRLYGKTGKPHPDMKILAQKIKNEFKKHNL